MWMIIITIVIVSVCSYLYIQNHVLQLSEIEVEDENLPIAFHGYRILHLSDIHNMNTKGNITTYALKYQADIVVVSGDLLYKYHPSYQYVMDELSELAKHVDVYAVSGNHEAWVTQVINDELREQLKAKGVHVLSDERIELKRDDAHIDLIGMEDISFIHGENYTSAEVNIFADILHKLHRRDHFTILISHRPELMRTYVNEKISLVFSGHAHGGQIRIPFIGGLLAPGQGWFPHYDSGKYKEGQTTMIVSRGIGKSAFPFRINNRSHIILVTLKHQIK